MANIKELSKMPERLTGGHRLCSGCGASIAVRQVLLGTKDPVVAGAATGCLEVATTIYPFTAWNIPFIHNAFENVAATISGAETAYRALKKKGKITKDIKFVAFGGDGGTYDIGLQSLSGVLERGHNMVYVTYDNEGYMNCLSLDSMIMTKEGLKKITDIKIGEEVYAFDQKAYEPILKRCTGVIDNGVKEVFKVETPHHLIKATENHPFLVLERSNSRKTNNFIWKTVGNIKVGDEVVTYKDIGGSRSFELPDFLKSNGSHTFSYKNGNSSLPLYETKVLTERQFDNENFKTEKIVSIKSVGKEPTLDLRVEGEHNFIADGFVVHNTGTQRSSATPKGASTTTTPAGKVSYGKEERRKDLTAIVAAHNIPYVAQSSMSHWNDLVTKSQKAFAVEGPAFLNVLALCNLGWRFPPEKTVEIAKLAVETGFWPLYEIENGVWKINYRPKQRKPLIEFLKPQGRFKHLFKEENKHIIDEMQKEVEEHWVRLEKMCEATKKEEAPKVEEAKS